MSKFKKIFAFLYKIENKIRIVLSHKPFLYAFIGSLGVVLIWRGIWVTADDFGIPGWVSLIIGIIISAMTGLFVSLFIGDKIIISGIKEEKRIEEKTEDEIRDEEISLSEIKEDLEDIKNDLEKNKSK